MEPKREGIAIVAWKGPRPRVRLRLAILLLTLFCTVLAWHSYRRVIQRYSTSVYHSNVDTKRQRFEMRIVRLRRRLAELQSETRPSRQAEVDALTRELTQALLWNEGEIAICDLQLAGFDVKGSLDMGIQISIDQRSMSDSQREVLLQSLRTISQQSPAAVRQLILKRTRVKDRDQLREDVEAICPQCKFSSGSMKVR